MRRCFAFTALGIAAVWLAWIGGGLAAPRRMAAAHNQPLGLSKSFASGWYCQLYVDGATTGGPIMLTLNADGTFLFSGAPVPGAILSTAHGSWKTVGRNTIVGAGMCIAADFDGNALFYEKGPLELTLSDDGNQVDGTLLLGIYSADQDPLGDDRPEYGIVPCTITGRRIAAD